MYIGLYCWGNAFGGIYWGGCYLWAYYWLCPGPIPPLWPPLCGPPLPPLFPLFMPPAPPLLLYWFGIICWPWGPWDWGYPPPIFCYWLTIRYNNVKNFTLLVLRKSEVKHIIQELLDLLILLLLVLLLFFLLWNPQFYQKWLVPKDSWQMEGLDCFLSGWDCVVENIGELIWRALLVVVLLDKLDKLNRYNFWVLYGEGLSKLLLGDIIGDKLDEDIWVECFSQILSNWVDLWAMGWFIILLAHMLVNNQEVVIWDLLLVHSLHSFLCVFWILIAHISVILVVSLFITLHWGWINLTEFLEEILELSIISSLR